ncbi:hypothetical protein A33M_3625 [Rhodovulum sp. PH10]|nr:hypothetical protein A33M_3625 [Rhodovulum sp. PH10]
MLRITQVDPSRGVRPRQLRSRLSYTPDAIRTTDTPRSGAMRREHRPAGRLVMTTS